MMREVIDIGTFGVQNNFDIGGDEVIVGIKVAGFGYDNSVYVVLPQLRYGFTLTGLCWLDNQ